MKERGVQEGKIPWKLIVGIILSVWLLRTFCAESFRIPANQMENTLLEGDHLWVLEKQLRCTCASNPSFITVLL